MYWDEVKVGFVLEYIKTKELYIVTEAYLRMDDPAHPFAFARLFCLTNEEITGTSVMNGKRDSDRDWQIVWQPE